MKAVASCVCLVVATVLASASLVPAAEAKRLSVLGTGHVDVKPDVMELSATVTGSAELTADSLKKFRNNRRRGIDAVQKLKVAGLELKGSGVSILSNATMQQYQQMWNGNQGVQPAGHTTFSETLTFRVPGIDRLSDDQVQDLATKILDAAKDAGLTMGQAIDPGRRYYDSNAIKPQIVFFGVANLEPARLKALELAAHDAQTKAKEMARRLNLQLGNPVSARDAASRPNVIVQSYNPANPQSMAELSPTLHSIPVEAMLAVEYEILN